MTALSACLWLLASAYTGLPPQCGPPPIDTLPVHISYYWPMSDNPINYDENRWVLADNLPWSPADYGHVAACPMELFYQVVTIPGLGEFHCRDTGGMIKIRWHAGYGRFVWWIDIMEAVGEAPRWGEIHSDWTVTP